MEMRLRELENNIQKLKTRYDQYFLGLERRPPEKLAADVSREIRHFSTTAITNTGLRFRVQQVVARYNTYLQFWQKNLKDIEEGRTPRRRMAGGGTRHQPGAGAVELSVTGPDRKGMEQLFMAVSREYRRSGSGQAPELSRIRDMVEKQNQAIRDKYRCEKVHYRVVTEDGKVKIKASPVTGGRS